MLRQEWIRSVTAANLYHYLERSCTPLLLRPLAAGRLTTVDLPLPTAEVNIVYDFEEPTAWRTTSRGPSWPRTGAGREPSCGVHGADRRGRDSGAGLDVPPLGPTSLRIAVAAASVNFPDVLIVRGEYQARPDPRSFRARSAPAS